MLCPGCLIAPADMIKGIAMPCAQCIKNAKQPAHKPKVGDVCLGCVHRPDPFHGAHWYWVGALGFQPHGADRLTAQWLFVCKPCFARFGTEISGAIERGEVKINNHLVTAEEMEFTFL